MVPSACNVDIMTLLVSKIHCLIGNIHVLLSPVVYALRAKGQAFILVLLDKQRELSDIISFVMQLVQMRSNLCKCITVKNPGLIQPKLVAF